LPSFYSSPSVRIPYWSKVYFQGIDHFITNSRAIVRLTNILSVTYPAVKGEVNSVDFIAIESLRVFCPLIYDIICKNPHAFAGSGAPTNFVGSTVDALKSLQNLWLAQVQEQDREPVKRLLMCLFPKLEAVWGGTCYGTEHESAWRNQLRICSLEVFPIYFRLALPKGNLSEPEIKTILALAKDAEAFGEKLVELANQSYDGTTQLRTFLEQLEDYTEGISVDCIPSIVQAFFNVGDRLLPPEDEPYGMFDFSNDIKIRHIICQLLRRLDEPARFEILKEAISNGKAVSTIVREVAACGEQQGKYGAEQSSPEAEWLLGTQHVEELEKLALERVQATEQQSLQQTPELAHILDCWRDLSKPLI